MHKRHKARTAIRKFGMTPGVRYMYVKHGSSKSVTLYMRPSLELDRGPKGHGKFFLFFYGDMQYAMGMYRRL